MAVDPNAEIAAEEDAVARLFEDLRKQAEHESDDDAVTTAVVDLLTAAVVPVTGTNRQQWECKLCGERNDNHTAVCPLPALQRWICRVP